MTNDRTQISTAATQKACSFRWKIEQLHREGKPVIGLECCQCRTARIQRNPIACCAFLVWVRLKELARSAGRTVYQLKQSVLDDYLIQQLKNPSRTGPLPKGEGEPGVAMRRFHGNHAVCVSLDKAIYGSMR